MKKISILGSTGSIGVQTLEVVRNLPDVKVVGLAAGKNIELLEKQIEEFKPELAVVMDADSAKKLRGRVSTKVLDGMDGLLEMAVYDNSDMVVNSVVGSIGLKPTVAAIRAGKDIGLANKETLVTAGELVMKEAEANHVSLYPIDSEHSAIFQCLQGNWENRIHKIYLTASGGPFRNKTSQQLKSVKPEDALAHPNWSMGRKITIDSATLMNKGLEVIEAKWLFGLELSQIEVVVHPQSIIHSMVEFDDGAVMAQLGEADMRIPIQYALTYPCRVKNEFKRVDFFEKNELTFERPDTVNFPCLRLAFDAIKTGGTMPAVLNAANEIAVEKFLGNKVAFTDIPTIIETTMKAYTVKYDYSIDDILEADKWTREFVYKGSVK